MKICYKDLIYRIKKLHTMPHRLKWKSKITGIESAGDWTNDKNKLEQQKQYEEAYTLGTIKYEIESKPDEYENKMNRIRKNLGL